MSLHPWRAGLVDGADASAQRRKKRSRTRIWDSAFSTKQKETTLCRSLFCLFVGWKMAFNLGFFFVWECWVHSGECERPACSQQCNLHRELWRYALVGFSLIPKRVSLVSTSHVIRRAMLGIQVT